MYSCNTIKELTEKLIIAVTTDKELEQKLHIELICIIDKIDNQILKYGKGFCSKFNTPLIRVNNLYHLLDIKKNVVFQTFQNDWGADAMRNRMYKDSYYHILLLIVLFGLKTKKEKIAQKACLLMLIKIWNGRLQKYFKYNCNERIMHHIISNLDKRCLFLKYDDPLEMLKEHFVPSLLAKYQNKILINPTRAIILISQAWSRIEQLFIHNMRVDLKTKKSIAQGGILPLYIKAKKEMTYIDTYNKIHEELEYNHLLSFDQAYNDNNEGLEDSQKIFHKKVIKSSIKFLKNPPNDLFPEQFIDSIYNRIRVSKKLIIAILKSINNDKSSDYILKILELILYKTNVNSKGDILSLEYDNLVQKNIISSKNNNNYQKICALSESLLKNIFTNLSRKSFAKYSNVQKLNFRKILIYGIVHFLKLSIAKEAKRETEKS